MGLRICIRILIAILAWDGLSMAEAGKPVAGNMGCHVTRHAQEIL